MHELEQNRPIGGMDMDSELRTLAPLDYLYGLNIRNAINQINKGKAVEFTPGNLPVTKYTLPYSVTGIYPPGVNRCIGAFESLSTGTIIFFVYNSNGNHQILRYYRNNTDPQNPYGEVQQVIMFNFGWQVNTRITSANLVYNAPPDNITANEPGTTQIGELLYWWDPAPRKINLTKGNICYKQKSWTIYAPQTNPFTVTTNLTLTLTTITNQPVLTAQLVVPPQPDVATAMQHIADALNVYYGNAVSAEACDCSLTVTEVGTTSFHYSITGAPLLMVPENWYGDTLIARFFDRCKWPPTQAPTSIYKADSTYVQNNLLNHVFQFRLSYWYDDLERSALGVWSQIAMNDIQCDGTSNRLLNYLDVNFNDAAIPLPVTLVILKQIEFIARDGNTNADQEIVVLKPCDFLDYDGMHWFCHYKFYNNVISTPVDTTTAAKQFDNVPLKSNAGIFTQNRLIDGAVTTGYDAPECMGAKATIQINNAANPATHKIIVNVRIFSPYQSTFDQSFLQGGSSFWGTEPGIYLRRGMVCKDVTRVAPAAVGTYYGGQQITAGGFEIRAGMEDVYDQRLGSDGFVGYLANTKYLAISAQDQVINGIATNLPTINNGVVVADTTTIPQIAQFYTESDPAKVNTPAFGYNDILSTMTFDNVPDGTYIIRLASNWCSAGDVLGKGAMYDLNNGLYQKTSMPVFGVNVFKNGAFLPFSPYKEIEVTVSGGDVFAGEFIVMDLADNAAGVATNHGWGYLFDNEGNIDAKVLNTGASVELATVEVSLGSWSGITGTSDYALKQQTPLSQAGTLRAGIKTFANLTDHNGFFYYCHMQDNSDNSAHSTGVILLNSQGTSGTLMRQLNSALYTGSINDFYFGSLTGVQLPVAINTPGTIYIAPLANVFSNTVTSAVQQYIAPTATPDARLKNSTFVTGQVIDQNGNPVFGASVVLANGRFLNTDINGNYELLAWGDTFGNGTLESLNGRFGDLIISASPLCVVTYPNGQIIPVGIAPFGGNTSVGVGPPYSPTAVFPVGVWVINENLYAETKRIKRGSTRSYGVRYQDAAGRQCSVIKLFDLYVPYETEDLSKFNYVLNPATGLPYTTPTYIGGQPTISWQLPASAPAWATTGQWLRTKNQIFVEKLQWVINSVQYVSRLSVNGLPYIDTTYQNGDAVGVLLSIQNIINYTQQNPGSTVGYTYTAGDRVRLIYDRNSNLLQGLYDYAITSFDVTTQSLVVQLPDLPFEIMSGFMIEIYTPISIANTDEQIYYEVGEVFNVANGIQPTSGVFTDGDTYWRGRNIPVADTAKSFYASYPVIIEDPSKSDFYVSNSEDLGRTGVVDPAFAQLTQPMLLMASDSFLPDTAINGLSSYTPDANLVLSKDLDRKYGAIQRLFFEQNNLIVVSSNKEISNYIGRVTLYEAASASGVQANSNEFFGTQYYHEQNLGTDMPAVCVTNSGIVFGVHFAKANAWKLSSGGEAVISDTKMINFFKQLSSDGVSDAIGVYDRFREEYIISYWRKYSTNTVIVDARDHAGGYIVTVEISRPSATPGINGLPQIAQAAAAGLLTTGDLISAGYMQGGSFVTQATSVTGVGLIGTGTMIVTMFLNGTFSRGQSITINYSLPETLSWLEGTAQMKQRAVMTAAYGPQSQDLMLSSQRWITFYSFNPECYSQLDTELFSFVGGKIWIHDKNPLTNNFYGQQYNAQLGLVLNEQPVFNKVWNALWLSSEQADGNCGWYSNDIFNSNGQLSRLNKANWGQYEQDWYTDFKRDLTDTQAGANPIVNGRQLRSSALVCVMQNDYNGAVTLYNWRANWTLSERTVK